MMVFIVVISGCQKEIYEDLPVLPMVDKTTIQKEVALQPVLNLGQIEALIKKQKEKGGVALSAVEVAGVISGLSTKSAEVLDPLIIVRRLDYRTSIVTDVNVTTFTGYLEIDEYDDIVKAYTFSQTYPIVDGKVVYDSYYIFDFEFDCPQNRHYTLSKVTNVWNVKYYFNGDDGVSFSYNLPVFNGENGPNTVAIIPFENGKGVVQGYNETIGNTPKIFETSAFDCYENTSDYLYMTFSFYEQNIKSSVKIDISVLDGASYVILRGEENGERVQRYCDVLQTIQFQSLSFVATFDVTSVRICGRNGCNYYSTKLVKTEGKISYYELE